MIKKLAWDTFKNTGNINTFLELVEFENIEKKLLEGNDNFASINNKINIKKDIYGNNQDKRNSAFRK